MNSITPIVVAVVWLWLTRRAVQHRRGALPKRRAASPDHATGLRAAGSSACTVAGCVRPAGPLGRCLPHS